MKAHELTSDQVCGALQPIWDIDCYESNGNYQALIAIRVIEGGKAPEEYTLAEIKAFQAAAYEEFIEQDRRYREAMARTDELLGPNWASQGGVA